jgi:casein kinase II subunit beta
VHPKLIVVYVSQASLDGAYFGSTFAHYFLLTSPELCQPKPDETYTPRIYGFKISTSPRRFLH